jgi:hypothetical protein
MLGLVELDGLGHPILDARNLLIAQPPDGDGLVAQLAHVIGAAEAGGLSAAGAEGRDRGHDGQSGDDAPSQILRFHLSSPC